MNANQNRSHGSVPVAETRERKPEAPDNPVILRETAAGFGRFVGKSERMRRLYDVMQQVGPSSAYVLLVGQSGTGKELAARTLHELSPRREGPFVALNCAAIPETLIEGELFGHEKGAFTGASQRRAGCFEMAHGGTLFLDEIAAMGASSQVKLLRVLEEQAFRRLRGSQELKVDVRIIAALNASPEEAVREGRLRSDLYYRLNVFTLELPPLRERFSDVPLLAQHFIDEFAHVNGKKIEGLEGDALRALIEHPWPGNVRELRNSIERAVIVAAGPYIELRDLPSSIRETAEFSSPTTMAGGGGGVPSDTESGVDTETPGERQAKGGGKVVDPDQVLVLEIGVSLEEANRRLIERTLKATEHNKSKAARILGISAKTIYNKLRAWDENENTSDGDGTPPRSRADESVDGNEGARVVSIGDRWPNKNRAKSQPRSAEA